MPKVKYNVRATKALKELIAKPAPKDTRGEAICERAVVLIRRGADTRVAGYFTRALVNHPANQRLHQILLHTGVDAHQASRDLSCRTIGTAATFQGNINERAARDAERSLEIALITFAETAQASVAGKTESGT